MSPRRRVQRVVVPFTAGTVRPRRVDAELQLLAKLRRLPVAERGSIVAAFQQIADGAVSDLHAPGGPLAHDDALLGKLVLLRKLLLLPEGTARNIEQLMDAILEDAGFDRAIVVGDGRSVQHKLFTVVARQLLAIEGAK